MARPEDSRHGNPFSQRPWELLGNPWVQLSTGDWGCLEDQPQPTFGTLHRDEGPALDQIVLQRDLWGPEPVGLEGPIAGHVLVIGQDQGVVG